MALVGVKWTFLKVGEGPQIQGQFQVVRLNCIQHYFLAVGSCMALFPVLTKLYSSLMGFGLNCIRDCFTRPELLHCMQLAIKNSD